MNEEKEVYEENQETTKEVAETNEEVKQVMTQEDIKEFMDYVVGTNTTPPESLNKMMNNLVTKLSMSLGYNIVAGMARQAELSDFIQESEKYIFDKNQLSSLDLDQMIALHDKAEKSMMSYLEFQRKFILQNKDSFKIDNSPQQRLLDKLMTLPPDKINSIIDKINDELVTDNNLTIESDLSE